MTITGGNILIHSGTATFTYSPTKSAEVLLQADQESGLLVYPNPFSDRLRFNFISPADTKTRIDLFDITGRLVQTVFNSEVKAGVEYNAEFRPANKVSGMYIYHMTIGLKVFNGKVTYQP